VPSKPLLVLITAFTPPNATTYKLLEPIRPDSFVILVIPTQPKKAPGLIVVKVVGRVSEPVILLQS
jgi:hypothetical protein